MNVEMTQARVLDEILGVADRVALVVVDMQRDFCNTDGVFGRAGIDISANTRIVGRIASFAEALREAGVLIVWIKQVSSPNHTSPALRRRLMLAPERLQLCRRGTRGFGLADGLIVKQRDAVVEKYRYSSFFGSSLDQVLRSQGIQVVVVVGTAANGCVDSTARDAAQLDYDVVIPRDLVGYTNSELAAAAIKNLGTHFAIVCDENAVTDRLSHAKRVLPVAKL